jgi:hypothetical protein
MKPDQSLDFVENEMKKIDLKKFMN